MRKVSKGLVSVIVGTKNEAEVVGRLLGSIGRQSCKQVEMIVVDNESADETVRIARLYTDLVFKKGPERSAQRNFGARQARGEYLLFLDADMELSGKAVEECVRLVRKDRKVGAAMIPEESVAEGYWEKVKAFERSFYSLAGDRSVEAARFFRREVFEKVGGYDETMWAAEDWDLSERVRKAGFKIGRIKAKIYHYERIRSLWSLFGKKYYYGLNSYRYLTKHKLPLVGAKTVYFLRPVFWRQWRRALVNPGLTIGMVVMFLGESVAGGVGVVVGKLTGR